MTAVSDAPAPASGRAQRGAALVLLLLGLLLLAAVGGVLLLLARGPAEPTDGGGASVVTLDAPAPGSRDRPEPSVAEREDDREPLPADTVRDPAAPPKALLHAEAQHDPSTPARPRDPGATRERLLKLRRSADPAVRLETARLVLADGPASPLLSMALEALAELAPGEVAGELRALVLQAGSDGAGSPALASSIRSLGAGGGVLSDDDLTRLYPEGSGPVQVALALTLSERGDDRLVRELEQSRMGDLQDGEGAVRAAAVNDLAALGPGNHVARVMPLLSDGDPQVRLAVLDALRMADDASLVDRVRPLLDDPERRVRMKAERIVQRLENRLDPTRGGADGH